MKKIIYLSVLLISCFVYSQDKEITILRSSGNYYYSTKEYKKAQSCYNKILEIDSLNSYAYSGIGLIANELGNKDEACRYLNKAYSLKNREVAKSIKDICGYIEHSDMMYLRDIQLFPKFKDKDNVLEIASPSKKINYKFTKVLNKKIKQSVVLKEFKEQKKKGQDNRLFKGYDLLINVRFDKNGLFIGDVYIGNRKKKSRKITNEVTKIINNSFEIIPARYRNKNVGTWDGFLARMGI